MIEGVEGLEIATLLLFGVVIVVRKNRTDSVN